MEQTPTVWEQLSSSAYEGGVEFEEEGKESDGTQPSEDKQAQKGTHDVSPAKRGVARVEGPSGWAEESGWEPQNEGSRQVAWLSCIC